MILPPTRHTLLLAGRPAQIKIWVKIMKMPEKMDPVETRNKKRLQKMVLTSSRKNVVNGQ